MPAKGQSTSVLERLRQKTTYVGDCWLWTGKTVGNNYGCIWFKGRMIRINRLIAHLYHKMDLDDPEIQANHTRDCNFNNCWNPEHIYVGTQQQNVDDQIALGRFNYGTNNLKGTQFAEQTHCINGHEFTEENTRVYETRPGHFMRQCIQCGKDRRQNA